MSDPQLADVARVCNRYPDIEVEFDVVGGETVTAGEPVQLIVRMDRSLPEGQELAPVHAPRSVYPLCKLWDTLQLAVFCSTL
jgi:pre-mRNA-splicing helicase BRR2